MLCIKFTYNGTLQIEKCQILYINNIYQNIIIIIKLYQNSTLNIISYNICNYDDNVYLGTHISQ